MEEKRSPRLSTARFGPRPSTRMLSRTIGPSSISSTALPESSGHVMRPPSMLGGACSGISPSISGSIPPITMPRLAKRSASGWASIAKPQFTSFVRRPHGSKCKTKASRALSQRDVRTAALGDSRRDVGQLRYKGVGRACDGLALTLVIRGRQHRLVPAREAPCRPLRHDRPFLVPDAGYRDVGCAQRRDAAVVPAEDDCGDVFHVIIGHVPMEEVGAARVHAVGLAHEMPDQVDLVDGLL